MRNVAMILALGLASGALADNTVENWAQSGDWAVLVDRSNGNGCLMRKDFETGIRVEFGFAPDRSGGFFAAYSKDWDTITPDTTRIVRFITDEAKFKGDVDMVTKEGWFGGWAFFNNPNLVVELAQGQSLTVIGPEDGTFEIDLTGTARAIAEVKKCQEGQN